jgi:hypothetical protein
MAVAIRRSGALLECPVIIANPPTDAFSIKREIRK